MLKRLVRFASLLGLTCFPLLGMSLQGFAQEYKYYKVQPNDTMTCIATRVYGRATHYMELASLNLDVLDVDHLHAGQMIRYIPGREKKEFYDCRHKKPSSRKGLATYKVKSGDTLWLISKRLFGKGLAYKKKFSKYNKELLKSKTIQPGMVFYYKPERSIASFTGKYRYGFGNEVSAIVPRSRDGDLPEENFDSDLYLILYVGMSYISYNQTTVDPSSESSLTARLAFQDRFKNSDWYVRLGVNAHFLPLGTQGANTPFQLADADLSFGHSLITHDPWKVILFAGGYGSMMFPMQGGIQYYTNLVGPQLSPVIQRTFANGNTLSLHFKYASLPDPLGTWKLENRMMSAGLTWIHDFKKGGSFSVLFDYSSLLYTDVTRPTALGDTTIDLTTANLSIGFGF